MTNVLACALGESAGRCAALSLYAAIPHTFTAAAVEHARLLAEHTTLALAQAEHIASLHTALESRQVIGEATGILMERRHIDARAAFALLSQASQNPTVKLRLVAEHVVLTGQDPALITNADLPATPRAEPHTPPLHAPQQGLHFAVTTQENCTRVDSF